MIERAAGFKIIPLRRTVPNLFRTARYSASFFGLPRFAGSA